MTLEEPENETAQREPVGSIKSPGLNILDPGLITGDSDDDPSGIATYWLPARHQGIEDLDWSWPISPEWISNSHILETL